MRFSALPVLLCSLALVGCSSGGPNDSADSAVSPGLDAAGSGASDASSTGPEDTLAKCQDGLDNDSDGHTDCADQDCWIFVACLTPDSGTSNADASGTPADSGAADSGANAPDAGSVAGLRLSARNFVLACPHQSIAGFESFGLEMSCTVYGATASNQFVPQSSVTLMAEAGAVPALAQLVPDATGGGVATFAYRTQCPIPVDVPPMGEGSNDPGSTCDFFNACKPTPGNEARTCNPRDGWATLVAVARGEEGYQDSNGNQQHDPGELFGDQPEPFVDSNDNGKRDADEAFYDSNKNGSWDDKNGVFDADGVIWTNVRVTWTGKPAELNLLPGNNSGLGAGGASPHCSSIHYLGHLKDQNGNPPTAANSAADAVTATCTNNCKVSKVEPYYDLVGLVDVTVTDAHDCPSTCTAPGCLPRPFEVDFSIARTLDTKGTKKVTEDLAPVIGVDPAPRSGTFE